jgi:soluble lytic murein transglycosylase
MNDDRSVRCYALMAESPAGSTDVATQVQELWFAQRDADDACAAAAEQQIKAGRMKPQAVWQRARLGMENDRQRIVTQAIALLNPDWAAKAGTSTPTPAATWTRNSPRCCRAPRSWSRWR